MSAKKKKSSKTKAAGDQPKKSSKKKAGRSKRKPPSVNSVQAYMDRSPKTYGKIVRSQSMDEILEKIVGARQKKSSADFKKIQSQFGGQLRYGRFRIDSLEDVIYFISLKNPGILNPNEDDQSKQFQQERPELKNKRFFFLRVEADSYPKADPSERSIISVVLNKDNRFEKAAVGFQTRKD